MEQWGWRWREACRPRCNPRPVRSGRWGIRLQPPLPPSTAEGPQRDGAVRAPRGNLLLSTCYPTSSFPCLVPSSSQQTLRSGLGCSQVGRFQETGEGVKMREREGCVHARAASREVSECLRHPTESQGCGDKPTPPPLSSLVENCHWERGLNAWHFCRRKPSGKMTQKANSV